MRKYSKYIVISPPHISNGGVKLLHGFRQIHKFDECGKKYAIHRIYKVTNISSILIHENNLLFDMDFTEIDKKNNYTTHNLYEVI